MQVLFAHIDFELQWANPLWDFMMFDASGQLEIVRSRLHDAIAKVPEATWHPTPFALDRLDEAVRIDAPWVWQCYYEARYWLLWLR